MTFHTTESQNKDILPTMIVRALIIIALILVGRLWMDRYKPINTPSETTWHPMMHMEQNSTQSLIQYSVHNLPHQYTHLK